jgi:hypothetical protein
MEKNIAEYLAKAVVDNALMPLDKSSIEQVLLDFSFKEDSTKNQFKMSKDEKDIQGNHPKNYQDAQEDGLLSYFHLRRVMRNKPTGYSANWLMKQAKEFEKKYLVHVMSFDSQLITRLVRQDPVLNQLMEKSTEMGYDYSIMSLWARTYHKPGTSEYTIRRPSIAIPGIDDPKAKEKIRAFEERFQKPSVEQVQRDIKKGKLDY